MNLNKIETDRPGFILPIWWNNQAEKTSDEPKETRKIHENFKLNWEFQFCFRFSKFQLIFTAVKALECPRINGRLTEPWSPSRSFSLDQETHWYSVIDDISLGL